jgi:hypothetical protein
MAEILVFPFLHLLAAFSSFVYQESTIALFDKGKHTCCNFRRAHTFFLPLLSSRLGYFGRLSRIYREMYSH